MIDKRHDVFISYAHKDNPKPGKPITKLVRRLKETYRDLYKEEINVFFDEDGLKPGELWENKLLESLRQSAVMIVILSSDYYNREYCYKEWQRFLDCELHLALPGEGILVGKWNEDGKSPDDPTLERAIKLWVQDLRSRQYFDISDWQVCQDSAAFHQRIVEVCELIRERKQIIAEHQQVVIYVAQQRKY